MTSCFFHPDLLSVVWFCSSCCGIGALLGSSVCSLMDEAKGLCKFLDGRAWQWEKLGLALVGRALLSKTLIQLSADGWGCTPSLVVIWPEAIQSWGL